jgi:chorismate mutase
MGWEMAAAPKSLDEVRVRIDAVDDELLRLLDERAGLARAVAEAKRAASVGQPPSFGLRPARETQVIRRLLSRPHPGASPSLIVRLWREVMGESLKSQGPFSVTVFGGRDPSRMADLARMRFGAAPSLTMVDSPEAAIAAAKTLGGVGVLPLDGLAPWARLLAEPSLRAFAILPCLSAWGSPTALAVAAVEVEPSGADQTLWITDAALPADRIVVALGKLGLAASLLADGGGLRLFALPGYVQADDARLKDAPGRLTGVIGAAPTPFDL